LRHIQTDIFAQGRDILPFSFHNAVIEIVVKIVKSPHYFKTIFSFLFSEVFRIFVLLNIKNIGMKRIICSLLLLVGFSAAVCSCEGLINGNTEEQAGTIYGTWVLDQLTIEASASVIGNGSQNTSVIDFTNAPCYLVLGDNMVATAQMGLDIELSGYSYDSEARKVRFNDDLSVSNDGKAMVLIGVYEITELTADKLVLRQPDFNIDVPGIFSSHQTAIYAFHRKPAKN